MNKPADESGKNDGTSGAVASGGSTRVFVFGGLLLCGAAALLGMTSIAKEKRNDREATLRAEELRKGPFVNVVPVATSAPTRTVTLLGEARPFANVTLYAKVSGYLSDIKVDKGDRVKKDQVLAVISSPETQSQYAAAFADARNKRQVAARARELLAKKLISDQEAETAVSDSDVSQARLEALEVAKAYERLRAPFPGTVTARFADPGALVQNAANSQTSSLPVVTISQVDKLRVTIYIDQSVASQVHVGDPVEIGATDNPELNLKARITRLSGELDSDTRTLLTEIDVDNSKGDLVAGSAVNVKLKVAERPMLQMPIEALVIRDSKSYVALVGDDETIHYREIRVGTSDGHFIRVTGGLAAGEKVALNIGNSIADGHHVRIVKNESGGAAGPGGAGPSPLPAVGQGAGAAATTTGGDASAVRAPQQSPQQNVR